MGAEIIFRTEAELSVFLEKEFTRVERRSWDNGFLGYFVHSRSHLAVIVGLT